MLVNTKGIPKAAVLSALFNNARGFGIGILVDMLGAQTGSKSMSIGEAEDEEPETSHMGGLQG